MANVPAEVIPYISCSPADYSGNFNALSVVQNAMQTNITAIILYTTRSDYCNLTEPTEQLQQFPIFSMTSASDSQKVLDNIDDLPASQLYFITIIREGVNNQPTNSNDNDGEQNQNPLGPSPSTAVAMIILYSITGIITALFLVIIITGAIRAHRNPERYGPRDVLGRPRQSRARGLGRAILDTIPIVKFGERETPKPTDVELGSTAEAREVNNANDEVRVQSKPAGTEAQTAENIEGQRDDDDAEQPSGIAPAQPAATSTPTAQNNSSPDEGLGCSICTDDFEKGQDIRVLPCNHKFHPECVDPWLLNVSGTCPLCRVDLRPTTSRTTEGSEDLDNVSLAPPLQPDAEQSNRRHSTLRDILSLRSRPNASAEERISALRRLREQRRNQSREDAAGSANASTEDVANVRRSRRISARFHEAFSIRTRRGGQEDTAAAASASNAESSGAAGQPGTVEESPAPSSSSRNEVDAPGRP
ncbi:hypothetical protein CC78DRAFT_37048 [Lojkania enalia]|uniref:RING-type domain-containing protein n=1 Tax=Lojkania enalia TaxID=147567 RepID=A0A9P4KGA8_9PLEO|nr:hypothetical protein CC78DRAFT_37048 [Didymosphaeria enalia]